MTDRFFESLELFKYLGQHCWAARYIFLSLRLKMRYVDWKIMHTTHISSIKNVVFGNFLMNKAIQILMKHADRGNCFFIFCIEEESLTLIASNFFLRSLIRVTVDVTEDCVFQQRPFFSFMISKTPPPRIFDTIYVHGTVIDCR